MYTFHDPNSFSTLPSSKQVERLQATNKRQHEDIIKAMNVSMFAENAIEQARKDKAREIEKIEALLTNERAAHNEIKEHIAMQQQALMKIPRIEEAHQRDLKRMHTEHIQIITEKRSVEMAKREKSDELRFYLFWRDKVPVLESTMIKQAREIKKLKGEVKICSSKYFNSLASKNSKAYHTMPSSPTYKGDNATGTPTGTPTGTSSANFNFVTTKSAAHSMTRQSGTGGASGTVGTGGDGKTGDVLNRLQHEPMDHGYTLSKQDRRELAETCKTLGKTVEQQCLEEILRLNAVLRKKDDKITRLSRTLSESRAHPLISNANYEDHYKLDQSDDEYVDREAQAIVERAKKHGTTPAIHIREFFADLKALDDDVMNANGSPVRRFLDDLESDSPRFMEEEARLSDKRHQEALGFQRAAKEGRVERLGKFPAHIFAIRSSKSFSFGD